MTGPRSQERGDQSAGTCAGNEDLFGVFGFCDGDFSFKSELLCICTDFLLIAAAPDKYHPEIRSLIIKDFKRVEDNAQSFVPHEPSDEEEARYAGRQVIIRGRFSNQII